MTTMIGYLQIGLVGRDRLLVEHQLQQCALDSESTLTRIYAEPPPQPSELWSTLVEFDKRHGSSLVSTVNILAKRDRVDIRRLQGGLPGSTEFWAAVADLEAADGGYLVVPSMHHLDNLDAPRQALMQRIHAKRPPMGVLDASVGPHAVRVESTSRTVIGEFAAAPVSPAAEIAALNVRRYLARAGLSEMIPVVEPFMHAMVGAVTEPSHVIGQDHRLTIQLSCGASELVVVCLDTRDYAGAPPHPAVIAARGTGRLARSRWGTGTETRCEFPLPTAETGAPRPNPVPRTMPVQVR